MKITHICSLYGILNKNLCVFVFIGCSRGPSPLTMGAQDTLPVAAAFTETVNAFFKGADPSKYIKIYLYLFFFFLDTKEN